MKQTTETVHVYLVVGPNCWGKGDTLKKARRNAQLRKPTWLTGRARYRYFLAAPSTRVTHMGHLEWDHGDPEPVEIGH